MSWHSRKVEKNSLFETTLLQLCVLRNLNLLLIQMFQLCVKEIQQELVVLLLHILLVEFPTHKCVAQYMEVNLEMVMGLTHIAQ